MRIISVENFLDLNLKSQFPWLKSWSKNATILPILAFGVNSCLHNVIVNLQTQAYLRILVNGVDWFYNSSPIGLMDARNYDSL